MATESGQADPPVADRLLREAYRFDFFQAVRVLERMARERARREPQDLRGPVGEDRDPATEVVRFRTWQSMSFPASPVMEVRRAGARRGAPAPPPLEMVVSFLGLTGPNGALPDHYTRLMIERIRDKNSSLPAFFDMFNHRLISLFFRAWEKYRFPFVYERRRLDPSRREDPFTGCLHSLVGMGTAGLRGRMEVDDESFLLYAGLFADGHRSAISLEKMLSDYFDLPVEVLEFQGRWLSIEPEDRSALPAQDLPEASKARLGRDAVLGERDWDIQSKFRVRVGPLSYRRFCQFIPSGDALVPLSQLVRAFVGPEFTFDVQVVLKAEEVPRCSLGGAEGYEPHLGWTTWLVSRPEEEDVADALFALNEV